MRDAWLRSNVLVVGLWLLLAVSLPLAFWENLGFSRGVSIAEIAEGFVMAAVLLLLFRLRPKLSGAIPGALARPVTISKNVRKTALVLFVTGAIVYFFIFFSFDIFYWWSFAIPSWEYMCGAVECLNHTLHLIVGSLAVLAAAVATLGLTVYRLDKGIASALKLALKTFTLPAVLILIVGLMVSGQVNQMPNHVVWFADWSLDRVYLVSNYFVLIVSVTLETILLLW